ncbi:energy transducer TonB [Lacinutrix sp. 5H-3-7-4]|uniref:energy transducer TonB n=1 Tax=Lacinutrix sp. (strain 5H-3-7-4) TaxID=983544 RepID=UPI00020A3749|nr:energy transducer TonB [Lacinutrix sp. 5H-3-7-4]AEH01229.1 TonB family protein [Lacinutrix sp. 5H-3-7-4]
MNKLNKSQKIVRQNDKTLKKSQKHEVNLQKNSTLYFQIGLILCLLASYAALEANFAITNESYVYNEPLDDELYDMVPESFVIEKKVEEKKQPVFKKPKEPRQFEVVDNDTKIEKAVEEIVTIEQPTKPTKVIDPDSLKPDDDPREDETYSILAVQKVPVYPGCERAKNNTERRACMSQKLGKLIQRKFDTGLGSDLGLNGRQKIYVNFKINKQGNVEIQKIRSPHQKLDKEAKRVVSKIPKMQPGKNNDRAVEVSYNLPIIFDVKN